MTHSLKGFTHYLMQLAQKGQCSMYEILCRDCEYHHLSFLSHYVERECKHELSKHNYSPIDNRYSLETCDCMRSSSGKCKPEGVLFKRRRSFLEKLLDFFRKRS